MLAMVDEAIRELDLLKVPYQYADYIMDPVLTALGAAKKDIKIDSNSFFLVRQMKSTQTGAFTVKLSDTDRNYSWSDDVVDNANIFGTAQFANNLEDPILLSPKALVQAELVDLSGAGNTIQIALSGVRIFSDLPFEIREKYMKNRWFQYVLNKTLTSLQNTSDIIKINQDSTFHIKKLLATSASDFQVRISTTQFGSRSWQNTFINKDNLFGTAQKPHVLLDPVRMDPNSSIQVDYKNVAASSNRTQVVFEGRKIQRIN